MTSDLIFTVMFVCLTTITCVALLCHTLIEVTRIEGRNKK